MGKGRTLQEKLMRYDTENKVYCTNCDHGCGVVFRTKDVDRKICRNCGHWIYRNNMTRLRYEMKERGVRIENL